MTSCTPIYQLPYPIGADAPCDIGDTTCAFAAAVEEELDRLDSVVSRTAVAIPLAKVSLSTPQTYSISLSGGVLLSSTSTILFDTVEEDTDNMVDLTTLPGTVLAQRTGIYAARCYIELGTSGSTANSFVFQLNSVGPIDNPGAILPPPGNNPLLQFPDPNLANSMAYCLRTIWRVTTPGSRFTATINYGAVTPPATALLNRAELDVIWLGD